MPMTLGEMLAEVRRLVGKPTQQDCNDSELTRYLTPALERLAAALEFNVKTVPTIALEAGSGDYTLPDDAAYVLWAEWGGRRLVPSTIARWTRESANWRTADSGTLDGYAIEGRTLWLSPAPSSAEIAGGDLLVLSYIATAPEVTASGVPGVTDADLWVAIYDAAADYLELNPGKTAEEIAANQRRAASNRQNQAVHLRDAKQRAGRRIKGYVKRFRLKPLIPAAR
jgi:hypothetical protein